MVRADRKVAAYANNFVEAEKPTREADRNKQCAAEIGARADQLKLKVVELQVTRSAELLAMERRNAEILIADLADFARQHPNLTPIEIGGLVAELKSKMKTNDLPSISNARSDLERKLNEIPKYHDFSIEVNDQRAKAARAQLDDLVATARLTSDFIEGFIQSNITSDAVEALLKMNQRIDEALMTPRMERLKSLVEKFEPELSQLGLDKPYTEFRDQRLAGKWVKDLTITDKNR